MKESHRSKRIFGLDVIRALAIILVVKTHGSFMIQDTVLGNILDFKMIDGVDMFFVLSGFLIGGILLKTIHREEKVGSSQLWNFWKRRWFRTLPNYYLILLLNYIVVSNGIIKEDITQFNYTFLIFCQNLITPFQGFFWESWSLSVEEWFYILIPITIWVFIRLTSRKHAFLYATLLIILLPLVYRYSITQETLSAFSWDTIFRKTVICRLDSIGYGLLAAWIFYYYKGIWNKWRIPAFIMGIGVLIIVVHFKGSYSSLYRQTLYFSMIPLSVMLFLPMAASWKKANGFLARATVHISKISYSMYLINLALVAEVIRDNFQIVDSSDAYTKYFIYWAIVIIASTLIYTYFEKPVMNLRERFTTNDNVN